MTLADFSGGMNASVAVDKLDIKECLLAENCRLDEAGNILISGANSAQNTVALTDGTSSAIHSLFEDSSIGIVAGVGTSVFSGNRFSSLSTNTGATNPLSSKMSFGIAPSRVYMDLGGTGYWMNPAPANLITVDWAPPSVAGATVTGPNTAGNGSSTNNPFMPWSPSNSPNSVVFSTDAETSGVLRLGGFSFSIGTSGVTGIQISVDIGLSDSQYFSGSGPVGEDSPDSGIVQPSGFTEVMVTLLKNGLPVGNAQSVNFNWPNPAVVTTLVLGGSTDLWGVTGGFSQGDINNTTFGFQIQINHFGTGLFSSHVSNEKLTVYQGAGFFAGTGAGGTLTGTYTWKVTFTAPAGEESDGSGSSTSVVLSAQQGTLTAIPVGDARTSGRNVYRKGGLLTAYYLVGNISDNVTTTFSDNQSDIATLAEAVILPGDTIGDEPNTRLGNQQVRYPCLHYERIFWASGNQLIWSKPLNGFAYPVDFSTQVGDNKNITGLFSLGGELVIFKTDSIWRFTGTDENSFQLSKTLSPVGTDWPFTTVIAGGSTTGFYFTGRIIFSNRQGIWAYNGYTSSKISTKLDLWFRQVDRSSVAIRSTNGFHPPEITSAQVTAGFQAAASNTFYRLAYAEEGQTSNNAMLVLDLERGNITKRTFAAGSLVVDSVSNYFYAGGNTGFIVQLDDWNATNDGLGAAVNMDFQTKYNDLKLRGSTFAIWGIEFLINTNGESVTPSVVFDEGADVLGEEVLTAISVTTQSRVFRKCNGTLSRDCRNFSVLLNARTLNANSSGNPNIVINHLKIYYEARGARVRTGEQVAV